MSTSKIETAGGGGKVGTSARKKESKRVTVKGWPGYVREGIFVIEKRVAGTKFHVSTRCTSLRAALKQLERFEESPATYTPRGRDAVAPLMLDLKMIDAFHAWHVADVTEQWANDVKRTLKHWANHLKGSDLRNLSLIDDLKPFIAGAPSKPLKVASLKVLFRWLLREKGLVTRAQNVTEEFITPPFRPRQQTGASKAIEFERLAKVLPLLKAEVRDVLELLAATGWHVSEVRRFARRDIGKLRLRDAGDNGDVLATIGTRHKDGGKWHFTALLFQPHVDAALRIRERGYVMDRTALRRNLRKACVKAGVTAFNMGDMRASVLTWLRLAGVPQETAMLFVGHTSVETQNRFYVNAEVARAVLPRDALRVVQGGKTG